MNSEEQFVGYPIQNALKQLMQPDILGGFAIAGYVFFLPFNTHPDLATFVLVALGLLATYFRKGFRPQLERVDCIVILFVIAASSISTLLSSDPARSFRFLIYLCLNIFLLVLAASMVSRRMVQVMAGGLALFGLFHLSAILVSSQILGSVTADSLINHLHIATLIVPNDALILGLCLPSMFFLFLNNDFKSPLIPLIAAVLYVSLSVYVSYLFQSKLTLLCIVAALLAMTAAWMTFPRKEKSKGHNKMVMVSTIGLLLLLSASAWYLGNQSTTRLSLWSVASTAHTTTSEVLFGAGPNTFLYNPAVIDSEFDKGDFVIPWVHNLYLEAYYDQGLFGLTGILILTFIPLIRAMRIEDSAVRAMLMASMITFCVLALFEVTLTRRFYFAFLAIMYGLCRAQSKEIHS